MEAREYWWESKVPSKLHFSDFLKWNGTPILREGVTCKIENYLVPAVKATCESLDHFRPFIDSLRYSMDDSLVPKDELTARVRMLMIDCQSEEMQTKKLKKRENDEMKMWHARKERFMYLSMGILELGVQMMCRANFGKDDPWFYKGAAICHIMEDETGLNAAKMLSDLNDPQGTNLLKMVVQEARKKYGLDDDDVGGFE
jgi:hypothetical protein